MGGRGSSSAGGGARGGAGNATNAAIDWNNPEQVRQNLLSSGDYIGDSEVKREVEDWLNHNLSRYESSASVDEIRVISNPGGREFGDVEVDYTVIERVPVGRDPDTGLQDFDFERASYTETFHMRLRRPR